MIFLNLIHNVALLVSLTIIHSLIMRRWRRNHAAYRLITGLLFGVVSVIGMLSPVVIEEGVIFDGRSIVLCIAGLFGGPAAGTIAGAIAAGYRIWLGGTGAFMGVAVICEAVGFGVVFHHYRQHNPRVVSAGGLLGLGFAVHVVMLIFMGLLPAASIEPTFRLIALPVLTIYPLATVALGLLFLDQESRLAAEEGLSARTAELDSFFANSLDLLCIADLDGYFRRLNTQWERVLGYPLAELTGRQFMELVHPDDVAATQKAVNDLARHKKVLSFVNRYRARDGSYRWIEWNSQALDGVIYAAARDITERKQMAEALWESQQRFRRIVETSHDGVWEIDENLRTVFVNDRMAEMLGVTPGEMLGREVDEFVHPEEREDTRERLHTRRQGVREGYERRLLAPDGREIWTLVSAAPKFAPDGAFRGSFAIYSDITARKTTELAIRDSRMRLAQVIEFLPDATFVIDTAGKVLMWNRAMEELTGIPAADILGQGDYAYALPFYGARRPVLIDLVLRPDQEFAGRYRSFSDQGGHLFSETFLESFRGRSRVHLWNTASRLLGTQGEVIGAIESIRDISDWRELEEERSKMEAQLRQAQKMEAIGTLAGGIAHDFNNILGAILGYAELAQSQVSPEEKVFTHLAHVLAAAERARRLVRQILTFSRKVEQDLRPLNLNEAVRQAVQILVPTLPKMIRLELQLAGEPWLVNADLGQMQQVLLNLASNASDAMPEGGRVVVETRNVEVSEGEAAPAPDMNPGRYLLLAVTDFGQGMDAATRDQIFNPFFTTKEVGRGTGLGLSTVYGIVKSHGGHISCQSEPGRGTTFLLYLPAAGAGTPPAPPVAEVSREILGGPENILLVDDEEALRELGSSMLRDMGYQVATAANGEEALEMYRNAVAPFDLVILDLGMPGMGGNRCLRELLNLDPGAKVLIASGYSVDGQVKTSLREGARDFVAKPYGRADLLKKVRQVLDQTAPLPPLPPAA
ncbi:MAG: PAS domain S-box protein [Deltaproteobacteria bacterium]|nr:PAS domain S-box protein [Deltaproteobacteria bacterium]